MKVAYELVRVIPIEGGYVVRMRAIALGDSGHPVTRRTRTGIDKKGNGVYVEAVVDAEYEAVYNGSWSGDIIAKAIA